MFFRWHNKARWNGYPGPCNPPHRIPKRENGCMRIGWAPRSDETTRRRHTLHAVTPTAEHIRLM